MELSGQSPLVELNTRCFQLIIDDVDDDDSSPTSRLVVRSSIGDGCYSGSAQPLVDSLLCFHRAFSPLIC